MNNPGEFMYELAKQLFPICRSITGNGVRETLAILQQYCPDLTIQEVPSGTKVFDWTVPKEWNIFDAYIENEDGTKILDFKENNLHVMGYSTPVDRIVDLEELLPLIYTQKDQPDVIPYVTSYYRERYGFCMSEHAKQALTPGKYHIYIDSELKMGNLTYGEVIIPGRTKEEIFLSTYICHPSMANNELSGPCVMTALINWIKSTKNRKYTYRIIFIPETIGSITYLSKHYKVMKENIVAGFNISCVGDDRTFSYISSRYGNTLADRVAKNVLSFYYPEYKNYSFLNRGSDERQYCSPGIDLPLCTICRSKYEEYPEYHTSADNLSFISEKGLGGAYEVYVECLEALEANNFYEVTCLCEPQLGSRGLYPTISQKGIYDEVQSMLDLIAYADGTNDLIEISNVIQVPVKSLIPIVKILLDNKLLKMV